MTDPQVEHLMAIMLRHVTTLVKATFLTSIAISLIDVLRTNPECNYLALFGSIAAWLVSCFFFPNTRSASHLVFQCFFLFLLLIFLLEDVYQSLTWQTGSILLAVLDVSGAVAMGMVWMRGRRNTGNMGLLVTDVEEEVMLLQSAIMEEGRAGIEKQEAY